MALLQTFIAFKCLFPWINLTFVYNCGKIFEDVGGETEYETESDTDCDERNKDNC
jgi:hypothetical protein